MADLKFKLKIPFIDEYSGKNGALLKRSFELPVFEYDKTIKVQDATLTTREVMEDFDRAAHGIYATMTSIVDSILAENDLPPKNKPEPKKEKVDPKKQKDDPKKAKEKPEPKKGELDPKAVKTAQDDIKKELAPYLRNLTKLLEGTVDELGGNSTDEPYDPKDDKVGKKFGETMEKLDLIVTLFRELDNAWRIRRLRAGKMADAKPAVAKRPADDDDWLDLIQEVQQDYTAFEKQLPTLRKRLKAKQPSLTERKAPQKEGADEKEAREAFNKLVEIYGKFGKRIAEMESLLGEVARVKAELTKMLEFGRSRFSDANWPDVPDAAPVWNRMADLLKLLDKQTREVAKLAK